MTPPLKKMILLCASASLCLAALSGCGRRGAPELPDSAYVQDNKGGKTRRPQPDRPFFLDPLIKE